jgi:hypothetical protein
MPFNFYMPGADPDYDPNDQGFDWSSIGSQLNNPSLGNNQSNPDFSMMGANPTAFDYSSLGRQNRPQSRLGNVASAMARLNNNPSTASTPPDFSGMGGSGDIYNQYKQAIMGAPTPDQYAPSGWRRVGAAAAGIGAGLATNNPLLGMNIAENVVNQPYKNALNNWEARTGKLKLAADEERQTQQGKFNQWKGTQEVGNASIEEQRKVLDTLSLIENRASQTGLNKANIARIENDLKNPDIDLVKTDDGYLTAISKKGGNILKSYGKVNLSDEETEKLKAGLQLRNQLANTNAQGRNQLDLEGARAANATALENTRQGNRVALKNVPNPSQSQGTGISELEMQRRQQKAITDIIRDPRAAGKGWDKFFKPDPKTGQPIPDETTIKANFTAWQEFQQAVQKVMQANLRRNQQGF